MYALYKVYTTVLAERLSKEIETKGLIPPNQTGFRRDGGDREYLQNYLVIGQLGEKKVRGDGGGFYRF